MQPPPPLPFSPHERQRLPVRYHTDATRRQLIRWIHYRMWSLFVERNTYGDRFWWPTSIQTFLVDYALGWTLTCVDLGLPWKFDLINPCAYCNYWEHQHINGQCLFRASSYTPGQYSFRTKDPDVPVYYYVLRTWSP